MQNKTRIASHQRLVYKIVTLSLLIFFKFTTVTFGQNSAQQHTSYNINNLTFFILIAFIIISAVIICIKFNKKCQQNLSSAKQYSAEKEEKIRKLITASHPAGDTGYIESMTKALQDVTDATYTFIGQVQTNGAIKTLALSKDKMLLPNFEYSLEGTPCSDTLESEKCIYKQNVAKDFPEDHLLEEMGIQAYIGLRILDQNNKNIGVIVSLYESSIADSSVHEFLFELFAPNIGRELELTDERNRLKSSEQMYKQIIEGTGELATTVNSEGIFTYVNHMTRTIFGLQPEECIGKSAFDMIHPDDKSSTEDWFVNFIAAGSTKGTYENRQVSTSGKVCDMLWSCTANYSPQGKIESIDSIARDITKRKEAEKELRQEQLFTKTILDNIPGLLSVCTTSGTPIRWNKDFERISGYSPQELQSMDISDFFEADSSESFLAHKALESVNVQGYSEVQTSFMTKNEKKIPYQFSGTAFEVDGESYILGIGTDISEQLKAKKEIESSRRILHDVINTIPVRVFWKDKNSRFLGCNKLFAHDAGKETCDEMIGLTDHDMCWKDQAESFCADDKNVMEQNISKINYDEAQTSPDGSTIWLRTSKAPLCDTEGNVYGVLGTYEDITERKHIENELASSRSILNDVMNTIPIRVFWKDKDSHFLGCNQLIADDAGVETPADMIGKTDFDFCWADQAENFRNDDKYIMESKEARLNFEEQQTRADGSLTWLRTSKVPLRDRNGDIYGVLGTYEDITTQKNTEDELNKSRKILDDVINAIPIRVFWKDLSSVYLGSNTLFAEDSGKGTPEKLIGCTDYELAWPDQAEPFRTDDHYVMSTGKSKINFEEPQQRPDGELSWLRTSKIALRDTNGKIYGVLGMYEDITIRKRSEEELRQLRDYLSNMINSMPSVLIGVNEEGTITHWNSRAEMELNVTIDNAVGQKIDTIIPRFSDDMDEILTAIHADEIMSRSKQLHTEEDHIEYEDITIYPLTGAGTQGAVIRIDDVTERVKMENMMIQTEKLMSLGGLAAGMAHEINNPLAEIVQGLQNSLRRISPDLPGNIRAAARHDIDLNKLQDYLEERKVLKFLNGGRQACDRAAQIVKNMLMFSRKNSTELQYIHLEDLLETAVKLGTTDYDMKKKYDFKFIDIIRDYETNLPKVPCCPGEIEQVLLNLFKNAIQATEEIKEEGYKPALTLRLKSGGANIKIEVEDNGPGIPENVKKRIFEPFFTTKPVGSGTGLGLSVSYMIITHNHHGTFSVESEPGKGTKFIIQLPLVEKEIPV